MLKINPHSGYSYNNLGISKQIQGDYSAAKNYFEKAIMLDSKNDLFYSSLGLLYELQGGNSEAVDCYINECKLNKNYKSLKSIANFCNCLLFCQSFKHQFWWKFFFKQLLNIKRQREKKHSVGFFIYKNT